MLKFKTYFYLLFNFVALFQFATVKAADVSDFGSTDFLGRFTQLQNDFNQIRSDLNEVDNLLNQNRIYLNEIRYLINQLRSFGAETDSESQSICSESTDAGSEFERASSESTDADYESGTMDFESVTKSISGVIQFNFKTEQQQYSISFSKKALQNFLQKSNVKENFEQFVEKFTENSESYGNVIRNLRFLLENFLPENIPCLSDLDLISKREIQTIANSILINGIGTFKRINATSIKFF